MASFPELDRARALRLAQFQLLQQRLDSAQKQAEIQADLIQAMTGAQQSEMEQEAQSKRKQIQAEGQTGPMRKPEPLQLPSMQRINVEAPTRGISPENEMAAFDQVTGGSIAQQQLANLQAGGQFPPTETPSVTVGGQTFTAPEEIETRQRITESQGLPRAGVPAQRFVRSTEQNALRAGDILRARMQQQFQAQQLGIEQQQLQLQARQARANIFRQAVETFAEPGAAATWTDAMVAGDMARASEVLASSKLAPQELFKLQRLESLANIRRSDAQAQMYLTEAMINLQKFEGSIAADTPGKRLGRRGLAGTTQGGEVVGDGGPDFKQLRLILGDAVKKDGGGLTEFGQFIALPLNVDLMNAGFVPVFAEPGVLSQLQGIFGRSALDIKGKVALFPAFSQAMTAMRTFHAAKGRGPQSEGRWGAIWDPVLQDFRQPTGEEVTQSVDTLETLGLLERQGGGIRMPENRMSRDYTEMLMELARQDERLEQFTRRPVPSPNQNVISKETQAARGRRLEPVGPARRFIPAQPPREDRAPEEEQPAEPLRLPTPGEQLRGFGEGLQEFGEGLQEFREGFRRAQAAREERLRRAAEGLRSRAGR